MDKRPPISKTAPIVAGQQGPTDNIVHLGSNRRERRAGDAAKPPRVKSLPDSIWQITDVIEPQTDLTGTRLFEIWIRRRGEPDMLLIYSKEGQPPQIGGLLERMTRPRGGIAAIWTDARATRASMGGGYTQDALPEDWGEPAKPLVGMTEGQKRMFGIPTAEDRPGYRQFPFGDRS